MKHNIMTAHCAGVFWRVMLCMTTFSTAFASGGDGEQIHYEAGQEETTARLSPGMIL